MGGNSALVGRCPRIIYSLQPRRAAVRSLPQKVERGGRNPAAPTGWEDNSATSINLHMERKNLLPPALLEQLRRHLYEVNFIYRRLPAVLERAVVATRTQRWGSFFGDQVATARDQRAELERFFLGWGQRPRPCACSEVDELLNEIHHALASRHELSSMEDRVHEVFMLLRKVVLSRLQEGIDLAKRLGDVELAARLEALFTVENDRQQAMPEMRAA